MSRPRIVSIITGALAVAFVAAVPIFLIAVSARWVINAPILYSFGFDRHQVAAYTGIEREELLSAGRQIRDYFNGNDELLDVRIQVAGVRRSIYNEREVHHMKDVRGLVRGVYRISEATGAFLLVYMLARLAIAGRQGLPRVLKLLRLGGTLTLAIVGGLGLGSLIGFERLFLAFHIVSFANDLWQLDPRTDYLVAMFPQGFFLDATLWIAGSAILGALIFIAGPTFALGRLPGGQSANSARPASSGS